MTTITLDAYLVRVRKKRKHDKKGLPFNAYSGSRVLRNDAQGYLNNYQNSWSDIKHLKRSFQVSYFYNNAPWLDGYVETGEYGVGGKIIDTTKGTAAYKKRSTDADTVPHYFSFCAPDNETAGLLLLQKYGIASIKGIFDLILRTQFRKKYKTLIMDIHPVVPQQVVKQLISSGDLSEVHFINHEIPSDIADRFMGIAAAQEGTIEHVVKPKNRREMKKDGILEFLDGKRDLQNIYHYNDMPFDTIKATVDFEGRERIIDLTKVSKFKASYNITDDVDVDNDGHPKLTSIREIAREYSKDLASKSGIRV